MDRKAYLNLMYDLLPRGQAWLRRSNSMMDRILSVAAAALARVHGRALDLLNEADPRTASEMLTDWERVTGLPDICSAEATTLQERRNAVHQKWISRGGQSNKYWHEVAERLGYKIEITEFRPFICGESECGGDDIDLPYSTVDISLSDDDAIGFYWRILVKGPRVTWFECGEGECGSDEFAKITEAVDLECQIRRLMPAHTHLIFAYENAPITEPLIITHMGIPVSHGGMSVVLN